MFEDKTSTNEQLEDNDTEHEADSTTEGEESSHEDSDDRTYTRAELEARLEAERKERDKRWRERLKKASGEESGEKGGQKNNSEEVVEANEVTIARLEARGILDQDIQSYLFTAAKREGKNPVELLSDNYFTEKIAAMKQEKEQEAARPAPSQRTGTTDRSQDLGYWLKQAEKGQLPPDGAMRRKVIQKLSGR